MNREIVSAVISPYLSKINQYIVKEIVDDILALQLRKEKAVDEMFMALIGAEQEFEALGRTTQVIYTNIQAALTKAGRI